MKEAVTERREAFVPAHRTVSIHAMSQADRMHDRLGGMGPLFGGPYVGIF
jgi:hypothetical protein